jgi:hypothetical protein
MVSGLLGTENLAPKGFRKARTQDLRPFGSALSKIPTSRANNAREMGHPAIFISFGGPKDHGHSGQALGYCMSPLHGWGLALNTVGFLHAELYYGGAGAAFVLRGLVYGFYVGVLLQ